jgi:hypothetical protein
LKNPQKTIKETPKKITSLNPEDQFLKIPQKTIKETPK